MELILLISFILSGLSILYLLLYLYVYLSGKNRLFNIKFIKDYYEYDYDIWYFGLDYKDRNWLIFIGLIPILNISFLILIFIAILFIFIVNRFKNIFKNIREKNINKLNK